MSNYAILDLSALSEVDRNKLIQESKQSDWIVTHLSRPPVHPDRTMSTHFYKFEVLSSLDLRRKHKHER